jgi:hypothetical protein
MEGRESVKGEEARREGRRGRRGKKIVEGDKSVREYLGRKIENGGE